MVSCSGEVVQSNRIDSEGSIMWYVIWTKSGGEHQCLELCKQNLDASSYTKIFVPTYITKVHFKKEWHDREKVLFPGYVFIDTDKIDEIYKQLKTVKVFTKLLTNAEEISPIYQEEQEYLQSLLNNDKQIEYSEGFIYGEKVCITKGPLRNQAGAVYKVDRHRRVAYLKVNLFGRQTPVEVGFGAVKRFTEEELEEIRQKNIRRYEEKLRQKEKNEMEKNFPKRVRIKGGALAGMYGVLVGENEEEDEYAVMIRLFGKEESKVYFHKDEIKYVD